MSPTARHAMAGAIWGGAWSLLGNGISYLAGVYSFEGAVVGMAVSVPLVALLFVIRGSGS